MLVYFKSGYSYVQRFNPGLVTVSPEHTTSHWDGQTIRLKRFRGGVEEYAEHVSQSLGIFVEMLLLNDECNWRDVPKLLWTLERESQRFRAAKTKWQVQWSLEYADIRYSRRCGSLKRFLEEQER
jgi:hypothetical protein